MQYWKKTMAALLVAATFVAMTPASQVRADGAASTRNIILLGAAAAATLIVVNHNKQVHARYAADAQTQAALAAQRDDAKAAYAAEKTANTHLTAEVSELNRAVAVQHDVIDKLRQQIALYQPTHQDFASRTIAVVPSKSTGGAAKQVAVVAYGWGDY